MRSSFKIQSIRGTSVNCRTEQEPGQAEALSALSPLDSGEGLVAICFASDSISEYSWLLRFVYSSCFRRGSEDAAGTCASSVCGLSAACLVGSTLRARDGPSNVILLRTGWDKSSASMTLAVQFGCSSVLRQEVAVRPPLEAGLHGLMSVDSQSTGTISRMVAGFCKRPGQICRALFLNPSLKLPPKFVCFKLRKLSQCSEAGRSASLHLDMNMLRVV